MKKTIIFALMVMALGLAIVVAYVSVTGLMKVFSGAGIVGLIFFIAIELAKVVGTSVIHTFKKRLKWWLKGAIGLGILISMIITSMGIYGFLSNSYKASYADMEGTNNKIELVESKKELLDEDKTLINDQINTKRDRIRTLIETRTNQEVRLDSLYAKGWSTSAKRTEKLIEQANEDIENADADIVILNAKLNVINDSLNSYSLQIIELRQSNVGAAELSTLIYLSDITGASMDDVMKWFILLLIVIGDPMAVLFVIALNKVVNYGDDDDIPSISNNSDDGDKPTEPDVTPPTEDHIPYKEEYTSMNTDEEVSIETLDDEPEEEPEMVVQEEEKPKPVIPTGKVEREDIPTPKSKTKIERIGSNKEIRDENTGRVIFKKRQ